MTLKDFILPDQDGQMHTLSDYQGKWVILYFYPKDDTTGCTKEACSFIKKYNLNFLLLSDESKEVIKQYNAWGKKIVYGKEIIGILRKTYLINPEGQIVKFYEKVNPDNHEHTNEIMNDLSTLQK
jgi:peroxiredoxin Q/BCP